MAIARNGTSPAQIVRSMKGPIGHILKRDIGKMKAVQRQAAEVIGEIGYDLPFPELNTRLGGGLKPGNVLVLRGTNAAIEEAFSYIAESFVETSVAFRHFVDFTTENKEGEPPTPEVFVSVKWWENGCNTHKQSKQVFSPFKDFKAILIDDLDVMVTRGTNRTERLNRGVKRITQGIDRKKQVVIVGLDTSKGEEYPTTLPDVVHITDVANIAIFLLCALNRINVMKLLI